MIMQALSGQISGTGTLDMPSYFFGGALITADGTNPATIKIRENNSSGSILMDISTTVSVRAIFPIKSKSMKIYYSITGTGGTAQLFAGIN
jgi:hypothetical protein